MALKILEIVKESYSIFFSNYALILLAAVAGLIYTVLSLVTGSTQQAANAFAQSIISGHASSNLTAWFAPIISQFIFTLVVGSFISGAVISYVFSRKSASFGSAMRKAKEKYLVLFETLFIINLIGLPTSVLFFVAPFLSTVSSLVAFIILTFLLFIILEYITLRLIIASVEVVIGNKTPIEAIKGSWAVTKNNMWAIFGIVLVVGIVASVCNFVFSRINSNAGYFIQNFLGYSEVIASVLIYERLSGITVQISQGGRVSSSSKTIMALIIIVILAMLILVLYQSKGTAATSNYPTLNYSKFINSTLNHTVSGSVYVTNYGYDFVSIINSTKVLAQAKIGEGPYQMTYDKANNYVYILCMGSDVINVLDGSRIIANISLGASNISVSQRPTQVLYDPVNKLVYATAHHNLFVIKNTSVVKIIAAGAPLGGMAYNPSNGWVYIASGGLATCPPSYKDSKTGYLVQPACSYIGNETLYVVNNNSIISNVSIGPYNQLSPEKVVYNLRNNNIYVLDAPNSNSISVINGNSLLPTKMYVPAVFAFTRSIAYNQMNGLIYVIDSCYAAVGSACQEYVSIFNGTHFIKSVFVGNSSADSGIVYNPRDNLMYATDDYSNLIVSLNSTDVLKRLQLEPGNEPSSIAYNPIDGYVYVANRNGQTVSIINNNSIIGTVNLGRYSFPDAILAVG